MLNKIQTNVAASSSVGRGLPGFTPSATSTGTTSHFEAIVSPVDNQQQWMTHDRTEEGVNFEATEARSIDRFAIFSSPSTFWAATVCLAVATTILLGLICTFILMAFRKRSKLTSERSRPTPGSLYSSAVEATRAQMSACLSTDVSTLPSNDSKMLRLGPYPGKF